jgi:hypothetical protein
MKDDIVLEKSFAFALRIVALYRYLVDKKREFTLSKRAVDSGN